MEIETQQLVQSGYKSNELVVPSNKIENSPSFYKNSAAVLEEAEGTNYGSTATR